ncbi:PLP-dependent aminotransferase family protein [Microbulbifer sp. SSSA007]|uniref:MocR-like pyridoxine biosynthesis transcription factor PdxR n=1 Tax=Microbulbifer sp. SSSA007 TaxID=3243379 RepID=UPI0040396F64
MSAPDFIDLNISRDKPLQEQLYKALVERIKSGRYPAGSQLPSSRAMSKSIGVSRNTIIHVIEQLKKDGFLVSKASKGVFVSPIFSACIDKITNISKNASKTELSLPSLSNQDKLSAIENTYWPDSHPFSPGMPDVKSFPYKKWGKLFHRHQENIKFNGYGDINGYQPLRELLSDYLNSTRGTFCTPDQIIITSGRLESLDLCARLTLDAGDTVLMENPGCTRARFLFNTMHVNLKPLEVNQGVLNVDYLMKNKINGKLLCLTPNQQSPLGGIIPFQERLEILNWAEKNKCWILEGDSDNELFNEGIPVDSIQGLHSSTPVIYIGGFSRVLLPNLRLGYLISPKPLVPAFKNAKMQLSGPCPLTHQVILADFIREGYFTQHARQMRKSYQEKLDHFFGLMRCDLSSSVNIISKRSALNFTLNIPGHNDVKISENLFKKGFGSAPISPYYYCDNSKENGLVLGCANTSSCDRIRFISTLKDLLT